MTPVLTANKRSAAWPLRVDPIVTGSVDVWCLSVRSLEQRLEALSSLLTREEIQKAKAFRFERHKRRFCIARGMLRALLGEYLCCSPASVMLEQGAEGKPALAARLRSTLHFNVSHSADVVVYSFCNDAEVGTDVEYLDRTLDRDLVVNRAFSPAERECYRAANGDDRLRIFYHIWARKEARLKARGLRMASFAEESLNRIPVVDFTFGKSYVGAVALARPGTVSPPVTQRRADAAAHKIKADHLSYGRLQAVEAPGRSARKRAAVDRVDPYIYFA
jgi:4'-phosphopantetheinyl transferase